MTSQIKDSIAWEEEGARIASALDGCGSAVVVGDDPRAAAQVALGIGRAQARRRRVAIGDLVGEEPTLQALVPADAPHGIVDSFLYGVSMNKIAHPIDLAQNLYILPSGSGPIDLDSLMRNDRWRKLAAGFHEVDALLLLVTRAEGGALDTLIGATDGVVIVGRSRVGAGRRIIAKVPADLEEMHVPLVPEPLGRADSEHRISKRDGGGEPEQEVSRRSRRTGWLILLVTLIALMAAAYWAWTNGWLGRVTKAPQPSANNAGAANGAVGPVSAMAVANSVGAEAPPFTDTVANAADSARAAAFVLVLSHLSDSSGAALTIDRDARGLPAATYSPVMIHGTPWYRVTVGAFRTRAAADSMLRRSRQIETAAVLYAPFSIVLATGVARSSAASRVREFRGLRRPVFALVQDDGTVTLYAGAFETPEQSAQLLFELRAGSLPASVAYRTGTVFE